MTDRPTIVEFLRARLDEDEQAAWAATPGPWRWGNEEFEDEPCLHDTEWGDHGPDLKTLELDADGHPITVIGSFGYDANWINVKRSDAEHIARWDPARVLAEVEAKRDILDEAELMVGMVACDSEVRDHVDGNRWMWKYDILWPLARVYADHPDFNPAWAPGAEAAT